MSSKQLIDLLETLRTVCLESQGVFERTAIRTEDLELRLFLEKAAGQREQYARELDRIVVRMGGGGLAPSGADQSSTACPAGNADAPAEPVLSEVRRREQEWALPAYREALARNIPPKVGRLIGRQRAGIEQVQGRLVAYPR